MSTCDKRPWGDSDGLLICTRPAGHPDGHQYESTNGSHLGEGAHHGKDPEE